MNKFLRYGILGVVWACLVLGVAEIGTYAVMIAAVFAFCLSPWTLLVSIPLFIVLIWICSCGVEWIMKRLDALTAPNEVV